MILLHWFDNDFFEAYKKLDRLCSDLYAEKNGISTYIADMETKTTTGRLLVPSWDSDYKNLKHVRWVRNQIAHESDMLQVSETTDLSFVQDFYDRILSEEDPLTLLRKAEARQKRMRVNSHIDFLLFNTMNRAPLLAIEIDGTSFHPSGSAQATRDNLKDNVMEKLHVPLLRIKTNESGERARIEEALSAAN